MRFQSPLVYATVAVWSGSTLFVEDFSKQQMDDFVVMTTQEFRLEKATISLLSA